MKSHRKLWLLVACLFGAENYLKAPEAMVAKNTTVRPRTDTISTSYGFHGQAGEGEPVSPGEMDALSTSKTTSSAGTPQNGSVDGAIDTSGKNAASKPSTASGGWNFVTGKSDATSSKANSDGTLTITDTTDAQTGAVNPVHPGAEGVDLSGLDSQPAVKSEVNTSTDKSEADNSNINTSGSVKNLTSDKSEADKSKETSVNPISDEKFNLLGCNSPKLAS